MMETGLAFLPSPRSSQVPLTWIQAFPPGTQGSEVCSRGPAGHQGSCAGARLQLGRGRRLCPGARCEGSVLVPWAQGAARLLSIMTSQAVNDSASRGSDLWKH